jgi:hypothetical protein
MHRTYEDHSTGAVIATQRDVNDDGYWLTKVECPAGGRGRGGATRCMRRVLCDADRESVKLRLFILPKPDSPVRRRELREWYRAFGFVHLGDDHMERVPRAPE